MIKAENIIIKEKYKGLKNLVLICEAMDEFAKQYHKEQLTLTDVSQQRELLIAFLTDNIHGNLYFTKEVATKAVDEYLSN